MEASRNIFLELQNERPCPHQMRGTQDSCLSLRPAPGWSPWDYLWFSFVSAADLRVAKKQKTKKTPSGRNAKGPEIQEKIYLAGVWESKSKQQWYHFSPLGWQKFLKTGNIKMLAEWWGSILSSLIAWGSVDCYNLSGKSSGCIY